MIKNIPITKTFRAFGYFLYIIKGSITKLKNIQNTKNPINKRITRIMPNINRNILLIIAQRIIPYLKFIIYNIISL